MNMDSSLAGVTSIPLFIELKNDVDGIMSLNDNSLSQQIEFILQDPIPDRTPPATPKLNLDSNGYLVSSSQMAANEADMESNDYQLMDSSVIKVEHMDDDDDVGREEEITTLHTANMSTNTEEGGSVSLMDAAAMSEEDDDEDDISPSSSSGSSSSVPVGLDGTQSFYLNGRNSGISTVTTTNYHHRRISSIEQAPTTSGCSSSCSSTSSGTVIAAASSSSSSTQGAAPPPPPKPPQEFQCFDCVEKFDNKELFEIHKTGHANNMKCAICNMVLKSLKNYEKHCLRCKPYECQICGRVVRFRPNFIKHMRVHTGQQSERHKYKCDVCLKEFMSFEYFKVHKKIHNDNVNLTCEICGKVFSALASLRGHSKLHSGVKLHKCDVCGKGFGQRYNLKIHARTHTGDFPFECKICKKKLHTQSSLQTHMQTHQKDQTSQVTTTIQYEPLVAVKLEPIDQSQQEHQQQELQHHQQLLHQHEMLIQPKQEQNKNTDLTDGIQMYSHQHNNNISITTANATTNTTNEDSSNESHHDNMKLVIKNDVQNGPPTQVTYAQQQPHLQQQQHQQQQQQQPQHHHHHHNHQYQRVSAIIKSTTASMSSLSQSPSSQIISPSPSPSSSSSSSSSASSPASGESRSVAASTSGGVVGGHTSLSSMSSTSIRHTNENSPSLATTALIIKSEPNLYSSGDNSVDMFIKKEIIFDECSAPSQNSPPTSKFHSNFDGDDLVDTHDLTHSLPYSNLFEPNSIPDSIPDDLYPDDPDDFRLDHSSLGLQSSTTDGDFIKKEWVYGTGTGYTINDKFDDDSDALCDAANFIYN